MCCKTTCESRKRKGVYVVYSTKGYVYSVTHKATEAFEDAIRMSEEEPGYLVCIDYQVRRRRRWLGSVLGTQFKACEKYARYLGRELVAS